LPDRNKFLSLNSVMMHQREKPLLTELSQDPKKPSPSLIPLWLHLRLRKPNSLLSKLPSKRTSVPLERSSLPFKPRLSLDKRTSSLRSQREPQRKRSLPDIASRKTPRFQLAKELLSLKDKSIRSLRRLRSLEKLLRRTSNQRTKCLPPRSPPKSNLIFSPTNKRLLRSKLEISKTSLLKLKTLSRLLRVRSRKKSPPKRLFQPKRRLSRLLKSSLMLKRTLTLKELLVRKRRKNSPPSQKNARRSLILKLLMSRKFKNNLRTSRRPLEIPRVKKTRPDSIPKLKVSKKLLMMLLKILMSQPRFAKKLMANLLKLLRNLPPKSRN